MTFSANVTRPTPATDLVVHGHRGEGTPSLQKDGLQLPRFAPVVDTASAKWVDGEVATATRKGNGVLGMRVRIEAATETAHDIIVGNWEEALEQLSYETTVVLDGRTWVFTCLPGSIALANNSRSGLVGLDWYTIQIPVMPNPVVT